MKNQNLLLQDFGLSTFTQDIFESTFNQDDERQLQKLILQQRKDKLEHGDPVKHEEQDDDDIPLSECLFESAITANGSPWASQSAPSSRRPSQKVTHRPSQQPYSILEDETLHEDDDEDLLPIGVLQDPNAKLLHPCQSAAEKYKNSILCRDPQLKISATQRQRQRRHDQGGSLTSRDRSRRSSFDPASIHHPTNNNNNNNAPSDELVFAAHPAAVMRSVSAHQHKRRLHHIKKPPLDNHVTVGSDDEDDEDDDDDDVPLFKSCLAMPSSIQSNVHGQKVGH